MYIIALNSDNIGSRPPLQSWNKSNAPLGYAICPDEFYDIFYSTEKVCGFVNITVEDNVVTSMEVNQEAYEAYIASISDDPAPEEDIIEDVSYDVLAQAITEGVNNL
jgi:hypothetical protein